MFTQKFIKIFHSVQEIGYFHFFRIWRSAKPRPMINVISQSLGLDVVNINAYAKFYQNIPNGLELSTFFTNSPVTKSSQTVRWQNQMFNYRALYESQPSVSIDFLKVVQYNLLQTVLYHWPQWKMTIVITLAKKTEKCDLYTITRIATIITNTAAIIPNTMVILLNTAITKMSHWTFLVNLTYFMVVSSERYIYYLSYSQHWLLPLLMLMETRTFPYWTIGIMQNKVHVRGLSQNKVHVRGLSQNKVHVWNKIKHTCDYYEI